MIGFLIFPEFQLLDAAGPISVFEIARRHVPHAPNVITVATRAGAVRSSSGTEMFARSLRAASSVTTLLVAGGEGVEAATRCKTTIAFIQRLAKRGVRMASVCNGAYLLAEAGLLDGRCATTHWSCTRDFTGRYPNVRLEPDQIFIRDDRVWTSAGITAGIDLALAMIAEDHGEQISRAAARQLVLYQRRGGGQSQFSTLLELKTPSGRFANLLSWVRENLDAQLTVDALAERAGLSARHFVRSFIAETGSTPTKAVERLRVEVARERVQSSGEAIERVALSTGFRDPERMRRAFIRAFGQPPQSLRRSARSA
ncbi:AraC family transcriptional regulator [Bradyrhizobium sacchari]|uniref:AraC family transcriptional regulator with amidase-like domain n=1 Tax=Bradyrhizobium sacchari TaxID=1399419 RepID=A0A560KDT6_9BRAD|nr:GlxA family transcriptional regulator [Bradyrhizobium sacchari]OPY97315.1 AraC family transcriptional regulator [Bradyrhizobium sacchari]TWB55930.1 AraC family transcriptional regulator with amidase-like domain [Bradyrhizobium sacchari]TWB78760.1 AraC family transcriptional regulator with amidase-like domain [Bradyrhizobium sacchari]